MRIATQNLLFLFNEGSHSHSGEKWEYSPTLIEKRINHYATLFALIDADILFLQELASEDMLQRIIACSGVKYSYFIATPDKNGVGNAVIYKKPGEWYTVPATTALPVFNKRDKDTVGPRVFSRRDFVCVQGTYLDAPLLMLGLHLKAGFLMGMKDAENKDMPMRDQVSAADGLIRSEFFRFAQAKQARTVIDAFLAENPQGNVVVAGDFNSRDGDVPLRIIQGVLKERDDVLANATDWLPEVERTSFGGRRLVDHILLSKSLATTIKNVQILNEGEKESKDIAPTPLAIKSDHPPIIVDVQ